MTDSAPEDPRDFTEEVTSELGTLSGSFKNWQMIQTNSFTKQKQTHRLRE